MTVSDAKKSNLILSPAPHIHEGSSISLTMYTIVIALLPVIVYSSMTYGWHTIRVVCLGVSSAMLWEFLLQVLFRRPVQVSDGSAMVTGLVLSLLLPTTAPWWLIVVGTFVAILVGKMIFGGLGGNPFNPALVGWAALRLSWKNYLDFSTSMVNYNVSFPVSDPLMILKWEGMPGVLEKFPNLKFPYIDLLMGSQIGPIGTTMVILVLAGGAVLLIRGVVRWQIPVSFIAGVALASWVFYLVDSTRYADPLFHIVTGSVVFGAFFLAPEPSSSPVNSIAMILFGLLCGVFVVIFRVWSVYPDGVVFSILIMNTLNPLLDKIRPKVPVARPEEAVV